MIEDEANQQKDKDLLFECLRCARKAFTKTCFKNYFMMFRYLFIRLDLIRMKDNKLQNSLYPILFEKPYLTNIIKDSFDRCKKLYALNKHFFSETCLGTTLDEFIKSDSNHKKIMKELNQNFFGGNEATENMFMSNIDEHIKEVLMVYKQMMNLLINFLNPQNITYMITISTVDSFNIILGLLVRLQLSVAYLLCWYHKTQRIDKSKELMGYTDFFTMMQLIDLLCNQSGEILQATYAKFIDQYFVTFLWMLMYFKRHHPEAVPNLETYLHRIVNQVYAINLSTETAESNSGTSEKQMSESKSKDGPFWVDEEEQEEIDDQLSSFDVVSMVKPNRMRSPDVYEVTMLIDLLVNNVNFQGLL